MKKIYIAPLFELVVINDEDIITASIGVEVESGNGVDLPSIGDWMDD